MTTTPQNQLDVRTYVEDEVDARALHSSPEDVRITCSFARAERLLGREYHGRFLIELLQNAADAWRTDDRSGQRNSRVRVLVAEGPSLLVANEGSAMTAEVVIETLGHIGASTRTEGKSIGHKGIGFKSVLEVALTPEIYSGLQMDQPALAVGFDPIRACELVQDATPEWDEMLAEVAGIDHSDELAAIPLLRYPHWIDPVPPEISELTAEGFDTVVRLPYDKRFADRLGLDESEWLSTIRSSLDGISDQMILLLGTFEEVRVEDRLAGTTELIRPEWSQRTRLDTGGTRETVRIMRDDDLSSRWIVHRRPVPRLDDLAAEIAIGWRLSTTDETRLVLATDGHPPNPFHLFFPTRIATGLPFLLHGYFKVNAARTAFYDGSKAHNQTILDALARLLADGMREVAETGEVDLTSVANLLAASDEPQDEAAEFHRNVMELLDDVPWVPVEYADGSPRSVRPGDVFAWHPSLVRKVSAAFPPAYVLDRVKLSLPDPGLTDEAMTMIGGQQQSAPPDYWSLVGEICRPGDVSLWAPEEADDRFLALLDLLEALDVEDRSNTESMLDDLRGDEASRLLPSAAPGGGRAMLPVPDPSEGVRGRRSRLVMARARATSTETLDPPPELDLAFLPDGLLSNETTIDRAKPLGVRPFTVDNVLDRLNGIGSFHVDGQRLLSFLWMLLSRERLSPYGTVNSAKQADEFDPSKWFWCQPGRAEEETKRRSQQRERYLADVPVPCRDGEWRAAGTVVFGQDWAEWLEEGEAGDPTAATGLRATAYRALERVSPSDSFLLAPPEKLVKLLPPAPPTADAEDEEPDDESRRNAERHAFLLRLGVWEVPPLEAFEDRERREEAFPWTGPYRERQQQEIEAMGGWTFGLGGWSGERHHNASLTEDYRFAWSMADAARRDVDSLVTALGFGSKLYRERMTARVLCRGCSDSGSSHTATRYSSSDSGYPSTLALQLRQEPWLPATLDGEDMKTPQSPESAWWHSKPPAEAGLLHSPLRMLRLCSPELGLTDDLRHLAGLTTIEEASVSALGRLLKSLRAQFEQDSLPVDPMSSGAARQAFTSLHRHVYDRLGELSSEGESEVTDLLDEVGVLCQLGNSLVYAPRLEARHDDGRFSSYLRHFEGRVPLVVLPRERVATASWLEIEPLRITLTRRGEDDGEDLTEELSSMLGDRIVELLAIVVHHSLGTQTLELASNQFDERARRLQALSVRRVEELVIDAEIDGTEHTATIGEGRDEIEFLEGPTSMRPVLYHDLTGVGWQDRLRRRVAPHIATLLENPSYTATFELFLQKGSDADREEFLLRLGISSDELDSVRQRIGVVGEAEKQRHLLWFRGILHARQADSAGLDLDPVLLRHRLTDAGFHDHLARRLVEKGGGDTVRRDATSDGALWLLADGGVEPRLIHDELLALGDSGLELNVTRRAFYRWLDEHRRRLAAVLSTRPAGVEAKDSVDRLSPPPEMFELAPDLADVLAPVVELLRSTGLESDAQLLANDPISELTRIGGFPSAGALDEHVLRLYDPEETSRALRDRAAGWRRIVRRVAVLARTSAADTLDRIRTIDAEMDRQLPTKPSQPSDVAPAMNDLLSQHPSLCAAISEIMLDSISASTPRLEQILALAETHGIAIDHVERVERALDSPRIDHARAIKNRAAQLADADLRPLLPEGLREALPPDPPGPPKKRKRVAAIKVTESHDRRKREAGVEGEQWALAAVIDPLLAMAPTDRANAVDEIVDLLGRFEGPPVDAALAHAASARSPSLDGDDLTVELTGLLHVSEHSDAFGFDMLGWLSESGDRESRAMCLEVKSSGKGEFQLPRSEWSLAKKFNDDGEGDRYAVFVVRRAKQGGVPSGMDLLVNPVELINSGKLRREVDGYTVAYRTD